MQSVHTMVKLAIVHRHRRWLISKVGSSNIPLALILVNGQLPKSMGNWIYPCMFAQLSFKINIGLLSLYKNLNMFCFSPGVSWKKLKNLKLKNLKNLDDEAFVALMIVAPNLEVLHLER